MAYKEENQLEEIVNGTRRKWETICSENTMFMFENVTMKSIVIILLSKTQEGDLSIWLKIYWLIKEILDLVFLLMLIKIFSLCFSYILDVFEQFSHKTTKIHRKKCILKTVIMDECHIKSPLPKSHYRIFFIWTASKYH